MEGNKHTALKVIAIAIALVALFIVATRWFGGASDGSNTVAGLGNGVTQIFVYVVVTPTRVSATPSPTHSVSRNVDNGIVRNEAILSGFPANVVPYRTTVGREQVNTLGGTNWLLGDPGVTSTHSRDEADRNCSAVFISPDTQNSLENTTGSSLLTEGGYLMASAAGMTFSVNGYTVQLPARANHEWIVVIRGLNTADGDMNRNVNFSGYNPGALLVTRFPVSPECGGFFSQEYLGQNVANSLAINGGFDVNTTSVVLLDINDGAYAVLQAADGRALRLLSTNTR